MSYTVTQNTSFMTMASVLQKLVSFIYFTLAANILGAEANGYYYTALVFTAVFLVFADFGMNSILTREAAIYPDEVPSFISTVFWTKFFFGFFAYAMLILVVNLLNYSPLIKQLIYLSGITMFFDNLHSVFYSAFRAGRNLLYEAFSLIGSQLLTLIFGSVALFNHWPLFALILAFTIPSFLNILYSWHYAKKIYHFKLFLYGWNKEIFKVLFIAGLPFALAGIIGRLYSFSDTLLMTKILSGKELGWWSVPQKIVFAFQFVPVALGASIYPAFSAMYMNKKEEITLLFEKSWRYLFFVSFPICFGIFAIATPVVLKIYGVDYEASILPLRILLLSLPFNFLTYVNGSLINAAGKQKIQTILMTGTLILSISMNLILLPVWGITGASVTALVSSALLTVVGYLFARSCAPINNRNILKYFNQIFWPAIVMSVAVYFLLFKINFFFTIPIGMMIYAILLFFTGAWNKITFFSIYKKILKKY
jgi:O-antigen/teichoic acid export membrane protein